jgi:hypothetical protein
MLKRATFSIILILSITVIGISQATTPTVAPPNVWDAKIQSPSEIILKGKPEESPKRPSDYLLGKEQSIDKMQYRAKILKINKSLNFEYDRFTDWSSVYTKPLNLVGGGEGFVAALAAGLARENGNYDADIVTDVYMTVLSGFSGRSLNTTPDNYGVLFATKATTWQFLGGDRTLYLIIDGSRRQYEPTASQNQVGGNLSSGVRTNETIGFVIPRTDLVLIANSSTVELRLGNTKPRKFKKDALERIRNLLQITAID